MKTKTRLKTAAHADAYPSLHKAPNAVHTQKCADGTYRSLLANIVPAYIVPAPSLSFRGLSDYAIIDNQLLCSAQQLLGMNAGSNHTVQLHIANCATLLPRECDSKVTAWS
jgi:hypothetical protein